MEGIDADEQKKFLDLARLHASLILDVTTDVADAVRLAAINSASRLLPLEYLSVFQKLDDILIEWLHSRPDLEVFLRQLDIARIPKSIKTLVIRCLSVGSNPADVIRRIRQISAFPLRINLRGAESCIDKLLEINSTRKFVPSSRLIDIVERTVTIDFLATFVDNIAPRHGNGSVAYVASNGHVKSSLLSLRQKDDLLDTSWLKSTFAGTILSDSFRHYPESTIQRPISPSKVMSVPKTWKKQRIVAIEDVTRMYGEQAVRGGLYAALKRAFPGHIDFSNASANQDMAFWLLNRNHCDDRSIVGVRFCWVGICWCVLRANSPVADFGKAENSAIPSRRAGKDSTIIDFCYNGKCDMLSYYELDLCVRLSRSRL